MLEVEIKASLGELTGQELQKIAEEKGFQRAARLWEIDTYFNGIGRDFMKTDEALRLRSCQNLDTDEVSTFVTYKGPKLDQASSTRSEYETAVGDRLTMNALLIALGFQEAFTVDKKRQEWKLLCDGEGEKTEITLCLDTVAGLGEFMELETLICGSSEEEKEAAVVMLLALLDDFGVPKENLTRKSYLEMLYFAAARG